MARRGVEALDASIQDVRNNTSLIGGVTLLLAGDFRRTLPVMSRRIYAVEAKVYLKPSYLRLKIKSPHSQVT